ncbi:MAG: mechanosensitive ion channel [Acidobacteria bacterium]|nr:mechanosensitive ion channel [Acidobacteriota bacterium]
MAINPTHYELQDVEREWLAQRAFYSTLRKKMIDHTKAVEEDIRFLKNSQSEWGAALNQIKDAKAPETVYERVRNVLSEIQNTSQPANERLSSLLVLQDQVSRQTQVVLDSLKKIAQAKVRFQHGLLLPDSPPLWHADMQNPSKMPLGSLVNLNFSWNLARTREFIKARRYPGLGVLLLFLAALVTSYSVRHRILGSIETGTDVTSFRIFLRPVSLALFTVLMIILPMTAAMPMQMRALVLLLFQVPVLRLQTQLVKPIFHAFLYALVVYGLTTWAWEGVVTSAGLRRWGLAVLSMGVIATVVWLVPRARREFQPSDRKARLFNIVIYLSLSLITLSYLANDFGYVGFSRVVRSGTLLSIFSAVVLYTACLVMASVLTAFSRSRKDPFMATAGLQRETVVRWTLRLINWAAFFMWAYMMLNFFTIREPVMGSITSALNAPIRLRAASITLGDVLAFILVLVAGIVLAGIIRVVLREDMLVRLNLKPGIPYAISTISYYVLLLLVFLLALSASGVELSRFTVLTGAFGLGAGFGLQNIISNFVSGIILLFERPIRIGDFLEVDQTVGEVIRMGMRSSSIRTPQGAEVIVPNSHLLSNQVVNWTLTEQKRRTELTVKVAYGADPEKVAEILVKTAGSHPNVMHDPGPSVLFLGFGDNSLDFELQFWVPEARLHKRVNSEVAMTVAREFREAGINTPAQKRELYVSSIDPSVKELLDVGDGNQGARPIDTPAIRRDSAANESKK